MAKGYVISSEIINNPQDTLRDDYQRIKNIKLGQKQSWLGRPYYLGAPNIPVRDPQITFLEKMLAMLTVQLKPPTALTRNELLAVRTTIAVCLYIKSQLSNRSKLKELIDNKLGITANNTITDEDLRLCLEAANILIQQDLFGRMNEEFHKRGQSGLCEITWLNFSKYVRDQLALPPPKPNTFPFASMGSYLVGQTGYYAGGAIGSICGGLLSEQLVTSRIYLTTAVGTIALLINVSPAGAALIAPVAVHSFLTAFFRISLGHLTAIAGKILGQGVGGFAGFLLDATAWLFKETWESVQAFLYNQQNNVTGYKISNGAYVCNGMELTGENQADMPVSDKKMIHIQIDIDEKGQAKALMDGKPFVLDYPLQVKAATLLEPAVVFSPVG